MDSYCYTLAITLRAPLLTEATGAMRFGLDAAQLKKDKNPVLSSSLIRGNIRHTLDYFLRKGLCPETELTAAELNRWFGQPSKESSTYTPERAQLDFGYVFELDTDSKAKVQGNNPEYRHRIRIDQETGTVEAGALQIIESCFKTGEKVTFTGVVYGRFATSEEANNAAKWLRKACQYLPAVGANKGTGFGQVISATCKLEQAAPTIEPQLPAGKRIGLSLKPDRPFCIAQPHGSDGNRFVGESHISGNVIKAALAQALVGENRNRNDKQQNDILAQVGFDKWVVQHAFAADTSDLRRTGKLPLSLVYANSKFHDLALSKESQLVGGDLPAFQTDWKCKVWDQADLGQSDEDGTIVEKPAKTSHRRVLDVHTSITPLDDPEKAGLSKEGQLFSLESIDPCNDVWLTDIDLSVLTEDERAAARTELAKALQQPLNNIGKTKARLCANPLPAACCNPDEVLSAQPFKPGCDQLVLMLNTAACILPAEMHTVPLTNGHQELHALYARYWEVASDEVLQLSHFYAGQHKVGGAYLHNRFFDDHEYRPHWLTDAGSVFVLNFDFQEIERVVATISTWLKQGIPPWHEMSSDWQQNPWLNQNGFGEVVLHPLSFTQGAAQGEGDE